tara:strand:- start:2681 stop:4135 length:1455 start_codon:yes stop_codon:yes gene_type:complete
MRKDFKKLCKKCDDLLKGNSDNLALNAISILHVLRGHPEILKEYNFFLNKKLLTSKDELHVSLPFIKKIFSFFLSFLTNKKNFFYLKKPKKIDCLIVSHLINPKHLNKKNDFYFGSLQSKLLNNKLSSLIVLRNFTGKNLKTLSRLQFNAKHYKVILSDFFKIKNEIKSVKLFFKEFFRIKLQKKNFDKNTSFLKTIGKIKYLKSIFSNIRISEQVDSLINLHKPQYLFITYEGHAWERVVIRKIKENHPKVVIIAYQFSIITKYHHAIFRPLKKTYNPDFIMTSGSVTADFFRKSTISKKSKIFIYGSEKAELGSRVSHSRNHFLILPEGFLNETKILLDFSILAAIRNPKFKFFFRFHPLVNKHEYINKNYPNKLPNNLIISENSLEQDFKNCKYAIYRGSASIIEAVSCGLIPLCYKLKNEVNFDPLFEFGNKLFKINNVSYFEKLALNEKIIQKEFLKIRNYCKKYFQKPSLSAIKHIIF